MVYPENYLHEVVNRGLLSVLRFLLGFQYVYLFHEPTHGVKIETPIWVRETNTHTETQGENAKPTINPSSQQEVHSFQGRMCML